MKIAFPDKVGGGAGTWIKLFGQFLINRGYEVTRDINDEYDLLVNLADVVPLSELKKVKDRGRKILYRMDGFYWGYLFPEEVGTVRNINLKNIMLCSDRIVFQSYFIKSAVCKELLGYEIDGEVIYNAADPELFYPEGEFFPKLTGKQVILCISTWEPPSLAVPLLKNIFTVAGLLRDRPYEFWLCGYASQEIINELNKLSIAPNLNIAGLGCGVRYEDMPKYLRTADLLLHLRPNDPCPNLIIEAMHCGTPVVGLQSGSLPELLGDSALLAACEDSRQHFPAIDIEDVGQKTIETLNNRPVFRKKVLQRAKKFSLETMGEKYLQEINKLL